MFKQRLGGHSQSILAPESIGVVPDESVDLAGRMMNRIVALEIHVRQDDQADPIPPLKFHVGAGAIDPPGMPVPASKQAVPDQAKPAGAIVKAEGLVDRLCVQDPRFIKNTVVHPGGQEMR